MTRLLIVFAAVGMLLAVPLFPLAPYAALTLFGVSSVVIVLARGAAYLSND